MDEERLKEIERKWDMGGITDTDFDKLTTALRNEFKQVTFLERELQFAIDSARDIIQQQNETINIIRHENENLKKLLLHIQKKLGNKYAEIISDY